MRWLGCLPAAVLLLGLGSLVAQFPETPVDEVPTAPAQGAASLVFVFDITGSMYDDLLQVIEGASRILATTLSRREQPLHNYVLVPFRDPDIGPVTVTTDPDLFEEQLSYLYVQGGGDCPEMAIGAIQKALEVSLPRSYIYVFTDARAKDYHLTDKVIELIQRKESQVVFVMTGDCGDNEHDGFLSYLKIASTSSGQVFLLKKHQVNEVLNFVQIAINTHKVNLISIDQDQAARVNYHLPVDTHLREFTVSISGEEPFVGIYDPEGNQITEGEHFEELLKLNNVHILNIKQPLPGNWTIDISASSAHTVRVTGISQLDFNQRFSVKSNAIFEDGYARPVSGLPMYTLINGTGLEPGVIFSRVDLLALDGQTIVSLPLDTVDYTSLYNTSYTQPPLGFFYVQVAGTDESGYPFIRTSKSAISSVIPRPPTVSIHPTTLGHYGSSIELYCFVDSLISVEVSWYKGDIAIAPPTKFLQTTSVTHLLTDLSLNDEGNYSCVAESEAGRSSGYTILDVTSPPPRIAPPKNVTVAPDERAVLSCDIESEAVFDVVWFRVSQYSGRLIRMPSLMYMPNTSLVINEAEESSEGWYVCQAENEGGNSTQRLYLKVGSAPEAEIRPVSSDFVVGGQVKLTCHVTASPRATIKWRRQSRVIRSSDRAEITADGELILSDMIQSDAGIYECLATNIAGSALATATLLYIEAPVIRLEKYIVLVSKGDSIALVCPSSGIPSPEISWYRDGNQITTSPLLRITSSGELMFLGAQPSDQARYHCVAQNKAGEDRAYIDLEVGSVPLITLGPRSARVDIGSEVRLPCEATGYPEPTYIWTKDGGPIESDRMTVNSDNYLVIRDLSLSDEASYMCIAENQFGSNEASASITVTGIVQPVIAFISPRFELELGETLRIQCMVVVGNPIPTISWYHVGKPLTGQSNSRAVVSPTGLLTLRDVTTADEGEYSCQAANIGGSTTMYTRLDVHIPPSIPGSGEITDVKALRGHPISLSCQASGDPEPQISWSKNGNLISPTDPHYYITVNGSLDIFSAAQDDTAQYTCTGKNSVGDASKSYRLTIQIKPTTPVSPNKDVTVVVGDQLILPCEVEAFPPPTITWRHNGDAVGLVKPGYRQLNSNAYKLDSVSAEDAGVWECIATNVVGNTSIVYTIRVDLPPDITKFGPSEYTVLKGDPVTLQCQAAGSPLPTIKWQRNGNFLTTADFSSGLTILIDGSLHIVETMLEDEGLYTCVAVNDAGTVQKSIKLQVHDPPTWPTGFTQPESISVVQGELTRFMCPAQGFPKPEILWFKDDELLTGNELNVKLNEDGSLELISADLTDAGRYTCRALNEAGDLELTIDFTVHIPPTLTGDNGDHHDKSLRPVVNSTLIVSCPVDAVPPPSISWYRNSLMLTREAIVLVSSDRITVSENGKILTVRQTQVLDAGEYRCVAKNVAGVTEISTDVIILVPPTIDNEGEEEGGRNQSVVEGRNLYMSCRATGNPPPFIRWFHNGQEVRSDEDILILDGGSRLLITNPQPDVHDGQFECRAVNEVGSTTTDFFISVWVAPKIRGWNEVAVVEVILYHNATLDCPATGRPPPLIKWTKSGRPITGESDYTLVDSGRRLLIVNASYTDRGRYECMADNKAGTAQKEFNLVLLIPPSIDLDATSTNVTTVQNQSVSLTCNADGDPYPEILWLRNDELVDFTRSNVEILANGRQLQIHTSQVSDEGIYTCLATNQAGDVAVDVSLTVFIPPTIEETEKQSTVVLGYQTVLYCPAKGKPRPQILWYKNAEELNIGSNPYLGLEDSGTRLIIANASLDSHALYTCRAANPAGRAERKHQLDVLVPPTITESDIIEYLEVLVNESVTIRCDTQGIPRPRVTWHKNGQEFRPSDRVRISDERYTLQIMRAELMDTARYTCTSSNSAGAAEKDFDLDVLLPPQIDTSSIDTNIRVVRGRQIVLNCPAIGTPYPKIYWYKNGAQIDTTTLSADMSDDVVLQSMGRQLLITAAEKDDSAQYRCHAVNAAGDAEIVFDVLVLVPPAIDGSNIVDTPRVRQNQTVIIECPAFGTPEPTITFLKEGRPIQSTDKLTIVPEEQLFLIHTAQVEDSGRYTCIAENEAGIARHTYDLQVNVPSRIDRRNLETDLSQTVNRTLVISCPVTGTPRPSIIWFKGRDPLFRLPSHMRKLNNDQQLEISNIQPEDEAVYSCKATNAAGRDRQDFHVQVYIPPEFERDPETYGPQTAYTAILSNPFSLSCPVSGDPKPQVNWYKDGVIITPDNLQYRISYDGETLDVISIREDDSGRYACEALNPAGKVQRDFSLVVYVPSSVEGSESVHANDVIIDNNLVLECRVTGNPRPEITWYKDNQVIDPRSSSNVRLYEMDQELHLLDVQIFDIGFYSCLATNAAGNDSKAFSVNVLVPPRIEETQSFVTATESTRTLLLCETQGLPPPTIKWYREGEEITHLSNSRFRMLQSGSLEFTSIQTADGGTYTCVAENQAGIANKTQTLFVQVPPEIAQPYRETSAKSGNAIRLTCDVTGTPAPRLIWQLGTRTLATYQGSQEDKSLLIENTKSQDSGLYICIAQNPAGTATGRVKLLVHVPPTIDRQRDSYVISQDRELQLPCVAQGVPRPVLAGYKDGVEIDYNNFRYRQLHDGRLALPIIRSEDAGVYTCRATNEAGFDSVDITVKVQVRATIVSNDRSAAAVQGATTSLICEAQGIPTPAVRWMKESLDIIESEKYQLHEDGTLQIQNTMESDRGTYTCEASNAAGSDRADVVLRVHVPPRIVVIPPPTETSEGGRIYLDCEAVGTPVPNIVWKLNGSIIPSPPSVAGRSRLVVENARPSDTGTYTCLAENAAGTAKVVAPVSVKVPPRIIVPPGNTAVVKADQVLLDCSVGGTPLPDIRWTKNGRDIQLSNRIQQLSNGSLLIYNSVKEDGGEYKCVASNDAGTSEGVAYLTIRSPPTFTITPPGDISVDVGATLVVDCAAEGEPRATISWRKERLEIMADSLNNRITSLTNSSLQIVTVQPSDSGKYMCVASNNLGSRLKEVQLTVRIDGGWTTWTDWSACTETCGLGVQIRSRSCSNPVSRYGGKPCIGQAQEKKQCVQRDCAVDGVWSAWQGWQECNSTCGDAWRVRNRYCDNPPPQFGGAECPETDTQLEKCEVPECPVDGDWSEWQPWQPCSRTCDQGYQERWRRCDSPTPKHGGRDCSGAESDRRMCMNQPCPIHGGWDEWLDWNPCSVSCGGGERTRARLCEKPVPQYGGRDCIGSETQTDFCNAEACPIHGDWSAWRDWGDCTLPCNGGMRRRFRSCDSPAPSINPRGRPCLGADQETGDCNSEPCPEGVWANWDTWQPCSSTCGLGMQTRKRQCLQPLSGSQTCDGEDTDQQECVEQKCKVPLPTAGVGNVVGQINGIDLDLSLMDVLINPALSNGDGTIIMANIEGLDPRIAPNMRLLSSLVSSFYWTTALELDGAKNGFSLTEGNFRREAQVQFATGEILTLTQLSHGIDDSGRLQVDIIMSGKLPDLPSSAEIVLEPYTEEYVQTGPGEIYGWSSRLFRVNSHLLPYAWNHTIFYDSDLYDDMPYLVQRLAVKMPSGDYITNRQLLTFGLEAYIEPGEPSDVCPKGFVPHPTGPYCQDSDECSRLKPCSHVCTNAPGGFRCSCPTGFALAQDARTCQDADECSSGRARCHHSQECINTEGSYRCVARCAPGFQLTSDGLGCVDINECEVDSPCDQKCMNMAGSFQCRCRFGFRLYGRSRCIDIDECARSLAPCSHECLNTPGGFSCSCPQGFKLSPDSKDCININECHEDRHTCAQDEECVDLSPSEGMYECVSKCPPGFDREQNGICVDRDECARETHQCAHNQVCNNLNGTYACTCRRGYRTDGPGNPCVDNDECSQPGLCQHHCRNIPGSYKCSCPRGFKLHHDGRSCLDRDECEEHNVRCGDDQKCFNQRGKYGCVDVSCPPNYVRLESGGCGLPCSARPDLDCLNGMFIDVIEYRMLARPAGIPANQDLLQLAVYNQYHMQLTDTVFSILENDGNSFAIRVDQGLGIVSTIVRLSEDVTYKIQVRSISYDNESESVQYQTTFIIYISVSEFPF